MRILTKALAALVWAAALPGVAQSQAISTLSVITENTVQYIYDIADPLKIASQPGVTPLGPVTSFYPLIAVQDVVSVNGRAAKGVVVLWGSGLNLSPNPQPGQAIADVGRVAAYDFRLDIQGVDGRPVGTIVGSGLGGGPPGPGLPGGAGTLAITGGTGAFLGASGQFAYTGPGGSRRASMVEDPAKRRINGGPPGAWLLQLIPRTRPEVIMTANGLAIVHSSDFTLVTASKPARPGEVLSLFATGLGPTRPGVEPGKPFPADPLQVVNSPVEVTVNGRPAEVLAAVGFPGSVDGYQVNFRIPAESTRGSATLQVSAAWIAGSEVRIPIQ